MGLLLGRACGSMKLFLLAYLVGQLGQANCCAPQLISAFFGGFNSGSSGGSTSAPSSSCQTTNGQACVFPFTFNGVTHNQCTLSGYTTPWCSTQTDGSGNHISGNYGDCASSCPGAGAQPTSAPTVPPANCRCGRANRVLKIVGGVQTEENEYPWQVGLISSSGSQHSSYNSGTVDYDFAVLRLCEDVTFQTDILPACLPTSSSTSYENQDAVVSGWGTTSSGGSTSSILREVTVRTMSNSQCTRNIAYGS